MMIYKRDFTVSQSRSFFIYPERVDIIAEVRMFFNIMLFFYFIPTWFNLEGFQITFKEFLPFQSLTDSNYFLVFLFQVRFFICFSGKETDCSFEVN